MCQCRTVREKSGNSLNINEKVDVLAVCLIKKGGISPFPSSKMVIFPHKYVVICQNVEYIIQLVCIMSINTYICRRNINSNH